jgi:hypothetical protein
MDVVFRKDRKKNSDAEPVEQLAPYGLFGYPKKSL